MLSNELRGNRSHHHPKASTVIISVAVVLFFLWFLTTGVSQLAIASILIAAGAALVLLRPDIAVIATLVYLLFMGDIRRIVSQRVGLASQDPLLVVGPIVIGLLFCRLLFERAIRPDTPLAKMVMALMVFMALEIFNPAQGGLTVGAAGAMFYIVPLLWFWAGRSMPSERIARDLTHVVIPLIAALAALLGLYQTFYGFLPFEAHWIREQIANGFTAMIIGGSVVRAFSFFTSPAEYAMFLGLAVVCCTAPLIVGRRRLITLLIPLLVWAMFLESVRGAIVLTVFAVLALASLTGRNSEQMIGRAFLAIVLGGGAMYFGLHRLQEMTSSDQRMETLEKHTFDGLLNPGESSATGHGQIAILGVEAGLKNPLGEGLGSTTMAASKLGVQGMVGYENDVANMFASLGMFGGLLYLTIILYTFYSVFVIWRDRRSFMAFVVFGILVSQLGYWLEGGRYSMIAIVWFFIGVVDRGVRVPDHLPAQAPEPARPTRMAQYAAPVTGR